MPATAIDLNRIMEVSKEQVRSYQENGYVQFHNVLNQEELEQVRADLAEANACRNKAIERMKEQAEKEEPVDPNLVRYSDVFAQTVNHWQDHEGLRQLTLSRRLGEIARRLVGAARMRLWHDHSLIKNPGKSVPSPWHQDWVYWPMNQTGALSCWMALDDVDENNGCLSFIPRSYRWGVYPPIGLVYPEDLFKMVDKEHQHELNPVSMPMKAGSCTFHDGLCFHYAPGNRTNHPRRAIAIIYMPDGTTYRKQPHCVTDDLDLPEGAVLEGDRFPIVAEGEPGPSTTFLDARERMAEAAAKRDLRMKLGCAKGSPN